MINKLSAFGDRTGERSSGGRDIGIQFQGDLFPNANGRRVFHYQIGVYNGEGVNTKDYDNRKDIIGGIWVMPIKGLRIGAFGWTGSRGQMLDPITNKTRSVEKNRYALSAATLSALSICTLRVGVLPLPVTTYVRLTTQRVTRPMVGMYSVSYLWLRANSLQRLVISAIAIRRNGALQ